MPARDPIIATYEPCAQMLEEIRAKSDDYSWLWAACRESNPMHETFERLRASVNPEKPYFFGKLNSGIQFAGDARDFPAALHALNPEANRTLIDGLIAALGRSGDAVDVGANIGVVASSLARHLGRRGRVFAFEPSPETFKIAAATIALNGLKNVTLTQAAVSEQNKEITFHSTPGNSAIASVSRHGFPFLNEWKPVSVTAVTLDEFMKSRSRNIKLIKIDIEGHELSAIKGAAAIIRKQKPTVVFEFTPAAAHDHGWTQQDAISLFQDIAPSDYDALVEGPESRRVDFPLPIDIHDQVNVFAVPKRRSLLRRLLSLK